MPSVLPCWSSMIPSVRKATTCRNFQGTCHKMLFGILTLARSWGGQISERETWCLPGNNTYLAVHLWQRERHGDNTSMAVMVTIARGRWYCWPADPASNSSDAACHTYHIDWRHTHTKTTTTKNCLTGNLEWTLGTTRRLQNMINGFICNRWSFFPPASQSLQKLISWLIVHCSSFAKHDPSSLPLHNPDIL